MITKKALLVLACFFGMFAYTSCQDDKRNEADEVDLENFDDEQEPEGFIEPGADLLEDNTVMNEMEDEPRLSTFYEGLNRAELTDDFTKGEGPYTIFAPSNIAYDELSQDERNQFENVENIDKTGAGMHYLVVRGKLTAEKLKEEISNANGTLQLASLQGENLTASMQNGNLIITDGSGKKAVVQESDIDASNGIVHIIDGVLQPKDLTRNDNPPRDWNTRNDQMDFEEADENRTNQNAS